MTPTPLAAIPAGISSGLVLPFVPTGGHELTSVGSPTFNGDSSTTFDSTDRIEGPASLIDETQMWVAARVRPNWAQDGDPLAGGEPCIWEWYDNANNHIRLFFRVSVNGWGCKRINTAGPNSIIASTPPGIFAAGSKHTIVMSLQADRVLLSFNGVGFGGVINTFGIPVLSASSFTIGNNSAQDSPFLGDILWLAMGLGVPPNPPGVIHAFGDTDPPFESLPGNPTFLWKANGLAYEVVAPGTNPPSVPSRGSTIPATIPA